jgi:hypothetical protein
VGKLVHKLVLVRKQELLRKLEHMLQRHRNHDCADGTTSQRERRKKQHHRRIPNQLQPCCCSSTSQQPTKWRQSPFHPKKFGSFGSNPHVDNKPSPLQPLSGVIDRECFPVAIPPLSLPHRALAASLRSEFPLHLRVVVENVVDLAFTPCS